MRKIVPALFLGGVLLFSACTFRTVRSATPAKRSSAKLEKMAPIWIQQTPERAGYHFFVGESQEASDKEQALEKAWISAFVRAGMTQFPELTSLSTESVEKLKESSFERRFVMKLERVNWTGMEEASDLGSPYVEESAGKFRAYRLLRWSDVAMNTAQRQVREMANYHLPRSPESLLREERQFVNAVQAIEDLNDKITRRNTYLEAVFSKVKCGVTIKDLIRILGKPDRENTLASRIIDRQLVWGPYRVEREVGDPGVAVIEREHGPPQQWIPCLGARHARLTKSE